MDHGLKPVYAGWRMIEWADESLTLTPGIDTLSADMLEDEDHEGRGVVGYMAPVTLWGDYCGSDLARSNHRSLMREFPKSFINVTGWYGSEELMVLPSALEGEEGEHLGRVLVELRDDYALYDEGDHSDMVHEIELEDWASYRESDVRQDLIKSLRPLHDGEWAESIVEAIDGTTLHAGFAEVAYANEGPSMEDAMTTYIPSSTWGEAIGALAGRLMSTGAVLSNSV